MEDEKCSECGKQSAPGVILVFAVMGIFWFVIGFAAGMCVPAKKEYKLGYANCQMDVIEHLRKK